MVFALRQENMTNVTIDTLLHPEMLQNLGQSYWKAYTAFIARQYLLTGPQDVTGGCSNDGKSPCGPRVPLPLMDGALAAMVLLTMVMLCYIGE